jgi:hypothetical protein
VDGGAAVKRQTNPGATYSSALPDGSGTTETGTRIDTSEPSTLTAPGDGLLALVTRRFNGFLFIAGQAHDGGHAWLWTPTGWQDCGYSHGVRPCAFGADSLFFATDGEHYRRVRLDTFETTDHARPIGSQGIRYVEGDTVVTGDETIFDGTVHEFIDRGDVRGGQGSNGGYCLIVPHPDGLARELGYWQDGIFHPEGGDCQFCNLERDGDQLAISIVKFLEHRSVFYLLTRAEADALPPPAAPPLLAPPKIAVESYDALMKAGAPWHVAFTNSGDGTRFQVSKDEQDRLWIAASNVAGADQTGSVRQLTVEGPEPPTPNPEPEPEPPPMHTASRFWCHPNIGSKDLLALFDDPSRLAQVDVFGLYVQAILTDTPNAQLGPNVYPALVQHDVFRKLAAAGIPLSLELGVVKAGDCDGTNNLHGMQTALQRVHDAGGVVGYLAMDEPLTASQQHCGGNQDACADAVATFIHSVAALDETIQVGWIEAWPEVSYDHMAAFLAKLDTRDALPKAWHLDIDWVTAKKKNLDPARFLRDCQALAESYGIALGVMVNSTVDPIADDATHAANLAALTTRLHGILPDAAHVIVQSWATRTGGTQDVPNNLGGAGLLASFANTRGVFESAPAPGASMQYSKLIDVTDTRGLLTVKKKNLVEGKEGDDDAIYTLTLLDDKVFSMLPTGVDWTQVADTHGPYERCTVIGNAATFRPEPDKIFTRLISMVGGL